MILLAIAISCSCVGLHIVIDELLRHFTGYDSEDWYVELHDIDKNYKAVKNWKVHLSKPLFACVTCMASIWGTIFYVLLSGYVGIDFFVHYVPVIMMVALFNTWIFKLYNR